MYYACMIYVCHGRMHLHIIISHFEVLHLYKRDGALSMHACISGAVFVPMHVGTFRGCEHFQVL